MNRYEVFMKVIDCGSFTGAARELNYTQSAVSQMVHTLEEELGAVLLLRSRTGIRLTADGEEYLPYIRAICLAHRDLKNKYNELQGLSGGIIRIGTFASVSRNWLPRLMSDFKEIYPGVQFQLFQGEYTHIGKWLWEGTVDFGFINPDAAGGLTCIPLARDEMLAVLPLHHPLAALERVPLADLAREPYILLHEGELSVPMNAFRQSGRLPDVQYTVDDDYTIMSMVEQGLGVSVLYRLVLQNRLEHLETRPLTPKVERTIALAYKNLAALPLASRSFIQFVLRQFDKNTPAQGKCTHTI